MLISPIASTSKIDVASAYVPCGAGSPVVSSTLRMPIACAPTQIGLHADQRPIAAGVVQQRLDVGSAARSARRARARSRARRTSGSPARSRRPRRASRNRCACASAAPEVEPARRRHFGDDRRTGRRRARARARTSRADRPALTAVCPSAGDDATRAGRAAGAVVRTAGRDLPDVFRRRAAAAADQARAGGDEAARVARHVVRRTEIQVAAVDVARAAGVRLRGQPRVRRAAPCARRSRASRAGPTAAVDADDIRARAARAPARTFPAACRPGCCRRLRSSSARRSAARRRCAPRESPRRSRSDRGRSRG